MTPSFSPVLLSRTHRPTHHSGRRALVGFMLDGGAPPRSQAFPAKSCFCNCKETQPFFAVVLE